jgi:N-carbamoylputrescine amidase
VADPDGQLSGLVRKTMAEVNVFRCATGPHVVATPVGKLGVGICADVHFIPFVRAMQTQAVDLVLMPHAWPGPYETGWAISQKDIMRTNTKARGLASVYANLLGVPVVLANQVGARGTERWGGLLGSLLDPAHNRFLGCSTIADSDGAVVRQMDDATEGVIVADVTLDPACKVTTPPLGHGRYGGGWIDAGMPNDTVRDLICSLDAFFGRRSYQRSDKRRGLAAAAQAHPPQSVSMTPVC